MAASDFKLFGRWGYDDVNVSDLSLVDYLSIKGKAAVLTPHTAGRYQKKRFRKALCPLVERLVNSLMMHGRNSGKKLLAIRIVQHAFNIIALMTDKNPLQVYY
ncbi:40S ribosomal protein S5, putative [Eimeria maxima]|uniref:40S ribosomal protein S5, putative n=1 Tax=Eimeria maxima TaxID=5804 RepID=U6M4L2_EIMMA|nr:40S ribosomal protein S5, putative [Eimeria maxima]CDJ57389.1 40S ribosomal protein S5, putative [Eimeria maxima]